MGRVKTVMAPDVLESRATPNSGAVLTFCSNLSVNACLPLPAASYVYTRIRLGVYMCACACVLLYGICVCLCIHFVLLLRKIIECALPCASQLTGQT